MTLHFVPHDIEKLSLKKTINFTDNLDNRDDKSGVSQLSCSNGIIKPTEKQIMELSNKLPEKSMLSLSELQLINHIYQAISTKIEMQDVIKAAVETTTAAFDDAPYSLLYLVNQRKNLLELAYCKGYPEHFCNPIRTIKLEQGFNGLTTQREDIVIIPDVYADKHLHPAISHDVLRELKLQMFVGIPLFGKDQVVGVMSLAFCEQRKISESEKTLLKSVGHQIGLAIHRAQILERERKRRRQLELINEVSKSWSTVSEFDELIQRTLELIIEKLGYWEIGIFILDENGKEVVLRGVAGGTKGILPIGHRQSIEEGIIGWVVRNGQMCYVRDVSQEPRYKAYEGLSAQSELCVPLRCNNKIIGAINMESTELDAFDDVDIKTIQILADQLSIYLENSHRLEQEKKRTHQLEMVNRIALSISSTLDTKTLLTEISQVIRTNFGDHFVSIYLYDSTKNILIKSAESGDKESNSPLGTSWSLGQGLLGLAAVQKRSICTNDVSKEPHFVPVDNPETRAELCVPILLRGNLLGVINIEASCTNAFDDFDLMAINIISEQLAQALNNTHLYNQIKDEKEKLNLILTDIVEGVALVSPDYQLQYANQKMLQMFPQLAVGKKCLEQFSFLPQLFEQLNAEGDTDSKKSPSVTLEFRADEHKKYLITNSRFYDSHKKQHLLVLAHDITDQKHLQEEGLNAERTKVAIELAGSIAHELNQPLTGILGYCTFLLEEVPKDSSLYEDLLMIRQQANRIETLVKKFQNIIKLHTKSYLRDKKIVDWGKSTS